jgi:hypothetical protein
MSRYSDEFLVPTATKVTARACREAVTALGWTINGATAGRMTCVTPAALLANPAVLEVTTHAHPSGGTVVSVTGSVFGFGPFQSAHLRNQAGSLREAIERVVGAPKQTLASGPSAGRAPGVGVLAAAAAFLNAASLTQRSAQAPGPQAQGGPWSYTSPTTGGTVGGDGQGFLYYQDKDTSWSN